MLQLQRELRVIAKFESVPFWIGILGGDLDDDVLRPVVLGSQSCKLAVFPAFMLAATNRLGRGQLNQVWRPGYPSRLEQGRVGLPVS